MTKGILYFSLLVAALGLLIYAAATKPVQPANTVAVDTCTDACVAAVKPIIDQRDAAIRLATELAFTISDVQEDPKHPYAAIGRHLPEINKLNDALQKAVKK